MGNHLKEGTFKSDKYDWCPAGFVPLKLTDEMAQQLLWEYADKRRSLDAEFAEDLQTALINAGIGMVPFMEYALIFGKDLGDGDFVGKNAVGGDSLLKIARSPITDKFNRDVLPVGKVIKATMDNMGILVEGEIQAKLKRSGRPSVGGKMVRKQGNEILEFDLFEIAWVKKA